jgi:hypothetical protein
LVQMELLPLLVLTQQQAPQLRVNQANLRI